MRSRAFACGDDLQTHRVAFAFGLYLLSLCLLFLSTVTRAQESAPHQLIVPLADGGYVVFNAETAAPETGATNQTKKTSSDAQPARAVFNSQALVDDNQIIHRLLVDAEGIPVFGYDLLVSPNRALKQFKVSAGPLDRKFESKLIARSGVRQQALQSAKKISTLPQSSESQVLDDGDSFALDLLINPDTGIKIVDVVKVSFDRASLWDINPKTLPRDFTLDAVQLSINQYQLLINGKVVATSKSSRACAGALVWFYVPDHGRFIFSLVPREGYQFQKVGIVSDNRIEFTVGSDHYEWISNAPVLRDGGAWNLWVLHDPKYTPLVYEAGTDPKKPDSKKKDKWDELDSAVKNVKDQASRIRDQKQTTFHTGADEPDAKSNSRARVMIGGADRIENLWPKN